MREIDDTLFDVLSQLKAKEKEKVRAKVTKASQMGDSYGCPLTKSIALYED